MFQNWGICTNCPGWENVGASWFCCILFLSGGELTKPAVFVSWQRGVACQKWWQWARLCLCLWMGRWELLQVGHSGFSFYLEWNGCILHWVWELRAVSLSFRGSDRSHNSLWYWELGSTENNGTGTEWLTGFWKGNGLLEWKLPISSAGEFVDWDSFSGAGVGWEICAGLKHCRKHFWLWNSFMFVCPHCYLKWKITSTSGMGMLLELQNYRLPNLLLVWALNSFLQTFTRLNLLLENSCSTLFPTEAQSFWRFIIFCTNCFSLYGSALNLEAKQSRHLPKQTFISNPGTTSNLTTQHRSTGVREDVAPWKLF